MGLRGKAPTPTAILEARGSPWATRGREAEPRLPIKAPSCPAWLSREAKAEWRRLVKALRDMGTLAEADRSMMTLHCEAWGELVEARAYLDEHGYTTTTPNGFTTPHPMVAIKNKARETLSKVDPQLGLSPASRARVKGRPPEEKSTRKLDAFKLN